MGASQAWREVPAAGRVRGSGLCSGQCSGMFSDRRSFPCIAVSARELLRSAGQCFQTGCAPTAGLVLQGLYRVDPIQGQRWALTRGLFLDPCNEPTTSKEAQAASAHPLPAA